MASDETLSKGERERRRCRPISRHAHAMEEFVHLRKQGHTYGQIAKLWDMRPLAGPADLENDVFGLWLRAGSPGEPPEPPRGPPGPDRWRGPVWDAWRAASKRAFQAWLDTFSDAPPTPHCETCTCWGECV